MITTAMAITRGAGTFNMVFDFAAASPAVDVLATDKWMLQIQLNKSTRIMKLNSVAGGAADQILLTPATDLVTIYLTEQEKNEIPDSGYAYMLYKWNETTSVWDIMAYAAVTSTGTAPAEYFPEAISWVNGNNIVKSTVGLTLTAENDIVLFNNADAVVCELPSAIEMVGKRFKIKADGAGDVTIKVSNGDTLIVLETTQESCEVIAIGLATAPNDELDWEVFFLL